MESLWVLRRERADPMEFLHGHVGPYRIGRTVRATLLGDVVVALHAAYDEVVELERYAALRNTHLAGPDGALLADLAHVAGLRHRHVAPIVGAGMDTGVPYVVRPHRLGRTLAEVLSEAPVEEEVVGAILHAAAAGIAWLAEQGPATGTCSMGGFDETDIFLGFDGEVQLLGTGTKLARSAGRDPIEVDLESLSGLARRLGITAVSSATSAEDAAGRLRRSYRDACGARAHLIGAALRGRFESDMHRERARFGLPLLH